MAKTCVFCGQSPEEKTKEHIVPRWLMEATGDPKRQAVFGTYNWKTEAPKTFAFDQLTFPACASCNHSFSRLEDSAKGIMTRLLSRSPLMAADFNTLLDWLDKVRVGLWLGLRQLEGDPWGIEPKYHIAQRIGMHDRSVGLCYIEGRKEGINFLGPESPCFGVAPTAMCLFVNDLALFNSSAVGLCSRRLGFPYVRSGVLRGDGRLECELSPGLERIVRPIERTGISHTVPFIYQPVFRRGAAASPAGADLYADYVRRHALDFEAGLGRPFLEYKGEVSVCGDHPTADGFPVVPVSLQEAYRSGRRWVYAKLERHFSEFAPAGDLLGSSFAPFHRRLIASIEEAMGL